MKSLLLSLGLILALWNPASAQHQTGTDTILEVNAFESALLMARLDHLCEKLKAADYTNAQNPKELLFPKGEESYLSGDTLWTVSAIPRTPNHYLDVDSINAHVGAMYFTFTRKGTNGYPLHVILIEWTQAPKRHPMVLVMMRKMYRSGDKWATLRTSVQTLNHELYEMVGRLELAVSRGL